MGIRGTLCIALLLALTSGYRSSTASRAIDDGEETFRNICAKCHGQAGTVVHAPEVTAK